MFRCLLVVACPFAAVHLPARADDPKPTLEVKGIVAPLSRLSVSARATGFVRDIHADLGAQVKKGDLLARLDDEALKLDLRVAQANAKRAEARFEGAKSSGEAEKRKCEAYVRRAKAGLDRGRKLGPAFSPAERETLELELTTAELALKAASDGGKEAVARAEVEVARAELNRVEYSLNESRLLAQMNGVVTHRLATVGQFVRPGDSLFEIADVSKLVAVVRVPEHALPRVLVGQPCRLVFHGGDAAVAGKVLSVSPVIDPATASCTVKVAFDAGGKPPRIGSSIVVTFLNAEK